MLHLLFNMVVELQDIQSIDYFPVIEILMKTNVFTYIKKEHQAVMPNITVLKNHNEEAEVM